VALHERPNATISLVSYAAVSYTNTARPILPHQKAWISIVGYEEFDCLHAITTGFRIYLNNTAITQRLHAQPMAKEPIVRGFHKLQHDPASLLLTRGGNLRTNDR
jgi:hypothetical protein